MHNLVIKSLPDKGSGHYFDRPSIVKSGFMDKLEDRFLKVNRSGLDPLDMGSQGV